MNKSSRQFLSFLAIFIAIFAISTSANGKIAVFVSIIPQKYYEANYATFVSGISELDADLRALFRGKQGLRFMVFHPAWGYFADTYGLKQIPVEIEGKNPKPAQLKKLITFANQSNINVIFAQPQFSAKSSEVIARGIDGRVVFADPLAAEWSQNIRKVAREIKAALR